MKAIKLIATIIALISSLAYAETPADYALKIPLKISAAAGLQRLSLPAAVFAASQSPNFADVRVFNSQGQAVPIAISMQENQHQHINKTIDFATYPIMAVSGSNVNSANSEIRIEESNGQRVVQVLSQPNHMSSDKTSEKTQVIGALIDAHTLSGAVSAIQFDADFAANTTLPITLDVSHDLKNWRNIAFEEPLYRFGNASSSNQNTSQQTRISLNSINLNKEYIRVSWPANQVFTLRHVQVTTSDTAEAIKKISVALGKPSTIEPHILTWNIPFSSAIAALDFKLNTPNALMPVQVQARMQHGEPWQNLSSAVVYRMSKAGKETVSPEIMLNDVSARELRVTTDATAIAFDGGNSQNLPQASLLFNPVHLLFVASGQGPFSLVVGKTGAANVLLPVSSLIPNYKAGDEQSIAEAKVDGVIAMPNLNDASSNISVASSKRSMILWLILAFGVLALAGVAWSVIKQLRANQ